MAEQIWKSPQKPFVFSQKPFVLSKQIAALLCHIWAFPAVYCHIYCSSATFSPIYRIVPFFPRKQFNFPVGGLKQVLGGCFLRLYDNQNRYAGIEFDPFNPIRSGEVKLHHFCVPQLCSTIGGISTKDLIIMSQEYIQPITEFITTQILKRKENNLGADDALISSGLVDSFSLVDLALFVEDTWGVVIDDTELNADTFDTPQQLAELIAARKS
jgi:acyl carrier protein